MAIEGTDINTDRGCGRIIDPDMAHSCISGLDENMAPGGNIDPQGLHGPRRQLDSPRQAQTWPRLQAFTRFSVITGVTDINTDPQSCIGAMDKVMVLDCSSGPDIALALGGKQNFSLSQFLTHPPPSNLPLSQHMNRSASLSLPFRHPVLAHHNGACVPWSPPDLEISSGSGNYYRFGMTDCFQL